MPMPTCGSHPGANIKMPYTRLAISQYKTYMAPMSHKTASHQGANKHGHSHNHYEEKVKEEYFNKEFEHGHSHNHYEGKVKEFNEEFENNHDHMQAPKTFDGERE